MYTFLPNLMLVDQGYFFGQIADDGFFVDLASILDVAVDKTGIDENSSL